MASEVRIDGEGTVCPSVVVLDSCRDDTAGNPLVCVEHRLIGGAWIAGVEVRQVGIDVGVPVCREVVRQVHISAVLFEAHTRTVVVGAAILCSNGR